MLKKKLGIEGIERNWLMNSKPVHYFKIPSTLIIPEGCKRIGCGAFDECSKLRKVIIPESIKEIGDCAFLRCGKDTTIILQKPKRKFNKIGDYAFKGCKYVKEEVRS